MGPVQAKAGRPVIRDIAQRRRRAGRRRLSRPTILVTLLGADPVAPQRRLRWPRGELNLPLPLVTGKAFPEDEAVFRVAVHDGDVTTRAVYERRFGALN